MFHFASLKLALLYLLILMAISAFFSVVLYEGSARELDRAVRRQIVDPNAVPLMARDNIVDYNERRISDSNQAKDRLQLNLLNVNVIILIVAGLGSYFLARKTLEPIEESLDAQKRFASDASHELRTPLTALKTETEVALRDKNLNLKEAIAQLKSNLQEINKLDELITKLLVLSKNGDLPLSPTKFDIATLIQDVATKLKPLAKKKQINLSVDNKSLSVYLDKDQLEQVLVILLDNAIKYTPSKGMATVRAFKDHEKLCITVHDTGEGIDTKDLPHIFTRFFRADKARTKSGTGGYGLGLSIADRIIKRMRGVVHVTSSKEEGTTFTITIPQNTIHS